MDTEEGLDAEHSVATTHGDGLPQRPQVSQDDLPSTTSLEASHKAAAGVLV